MYKNYERATRVVPRITVQELNRKDVECDGVRDNKRRDVARGVLSSFANESKRCHIVAALIEANAELDKLTRNAKPQTALFLAISVDNIDIAQLLFDAGARLPALTKQTAPVTPCANDAIYWPFFFSSRRSCGKGGHFVFS